MRSNTVTKFFSENRQGAIFLAIFLIMTSSFIYLMFFKKINSEDYYIYKKTNLKALPGIYADGNIVKVDTSCQYVKVVGSIAYNDPRKNGICIVGLNNMYPFQFRLRSNLDSTYGSNTWENVSAVVLIAYHRKAGFFWPGNSNDKAFLADLSAAFFEISRQYTYEKVLDNPKIFANEIKSEFNRTTISECKIDSIKFASLNR